MHLKYLIYQPYYNPSKDISFKTYDIILWLELQFVCFTLGLHKQKHYNKYQLECDFQKKLGHLCNVYMK